MFIESPVLTVFEAKNEDIKSGIGQCLSAMVGAQVFNERAGNPVGAIYGAVTTVTNWRFVRLEGNVATVDRNEEFWNPVERLLGILKTIVASPAGV
jgi:hypothetical protein